MITGNRRKKKNKTILMHPKNSIYELGYGQIPKIVMCDRELSVTAKAIYAYLCSYAGGGNQAFPGTIRMQQDLCLSKDTFFKHLKLLEESGYITKIQTVSEGNKFANNIYEFNYTVPKKRVVNKLINFQ